MLPNTGSSEIVSNPRLQTLVKAQPSLFSIRIQNRSDPFTIKNPFALVALPKHSRVLHICVGKGIVEQSQTKRALTRSGCNRRIPFLLVNTESHNLITIFHTGYCSSLPLKCLEMKVVLWRRDRVDTPGYLFLAQQKERGAWLAPVDLLEGGTQGRVMARVPRERDSGQMPHF